MEYRLLGKTGLKVSVIGIVNDFTSSVRKKASASQ